MTKKFLYRVICGFFLGLSVFAPGFSGSVMAIIMGIYHDLVRIVSNPFKQWKQNILFCIPLAIGASINAVLFVFAFQYLFETYEKATYFLFIGLIAGNLPLIFREVKKCGFKKRYLIGGAGAFAAALTLGIFATGLTEAAGVHGSTSSLPIFALSGFVTGISALVPGMSVSMLLIVMGVYGQLLFIAKSLLHLNFSYLLPFALFAACAVTGLLLASRGIKLVYEKFPGFSNSTIFGFMAGSLIGILIQSLRLHDPNVNWLLSVLMLAAGLAVSMLFILLGKRMDSSQT